MQTTSEKRYKLVPVTDLDIVYVGGMHDTITYGEGDIIEDELDAITVYVRDAKTSRTLERIICLKQNMCSYKFLDRVLRVEDKTPLPIEVVADEPTDA